MRPRSLSVEFPEFVVGEIDGLLFAETAAMAKYLKASNPTEAQTQKAVASVFKQAGLASA